MAASRQKYRRAGFAVGLIFEGMLAIAVIDSAAEPQTTNCMLDVKTKKTGLAAYRCIEQVTGIEGARPANLASIQQAPKGSTHWWHPGKLPPWLTSPDREDLATGMEGPVRLMQLAVDGERKPTIELLAVQFGYASFTDVFQIGFSGQALGVPVFSFF